MKDSLNQPEDVKPQSLEIALEYSTIHNQAPIVRNFAKTKFISVATCIDLPLATACSSATHHIARHPLAPTATVDSDGGVTATDAVNLELTAVAFAVEVELPIGCGDACEEEGGEKDEGTHFGYVEVKPKTNLEIPPRRAWEVLWRLRHALSSPYHRKSFRSLVLAPCVANRQPVYRWKANPSIRWGTLYRAFWCGVRKNMVGEKEFVAIRDEVPVDTLNFITARYAVLLGMARNLAAPIAVVDDDNFVAATDPAELDPTALLFAFLVEAYFPETILGCGEAGEENGGDNDKRTYFV
ncbi:MAG: hypothetical protein Q9215_005917 [Flavoplaca cf. flavocitrina]